MATTNDITISKGHTYSTVLRWGSNPIVRKSITNFTDLNGTAHLEIPGHGLLDGWPCAVTDCKGRIEINAADPNKVRESEYYAATVVDADTIELNEVNAAGFKPHVANTGVIQYNTPVDLTGITIKVRLWTKQGGTLLASNQVADTPLDVVDTTIDLAKRTITIKFPVEATELLSGKTGWYDIEAHSAGVSPTVTQLAEGAFSVKKE